MSEIDVCRVAVIGAGAMAREHIRAFVAVPGVAVVGIHSRTRPRAEALAAEFGLPGVYDTVAELFDATTADLVVVTVPEMAMNAVSQACFAYPWTVLLEKPAGYNVVDAQAIYAAAKAQQRSVLVALNRRLLSSTQCVVTDLAQRSGPRFIKVQDQQDQAQARAFGHPELVVQNWMYANSIHVVDYFRLLGRGRIMSVEQVLPWDPERPGVVIAKITFDSGDIGLYEGLWHGPGPWAVTVSTSDIRWEMRPLEQATFQQRGERVLQAVNPHPWDREFKPGFRLQAQMAVAAAMGQPLTLPTLGEALETMRLIQAIFGQ